MSAQARSCTDSPSSSWLMPRHTCTWSRWVDQCMHRSSGDAIFDSGPVGGGSVIIYLYIYTHMYMYVYIYVWINIGNHENTQMGNIQICIHILWKVQLSNMAHRRSSKAHRWRGSWPECGDLLRAMGAMAQLNHHKTWLPGDWYAWYIIWSVMPPMLLPVTSDQYK